MFTPEPLPVIPDTLPGYYKIEVPLIEVTSTFEGFTVRATEPLTRATFFLPRAKSLCCKDYPRLIKVDGKLMPVRKYEMSLAMYRRMYAALKQPESVGR